MRRPRPNGPTSRSRQSSSTRALSQCWALALSARTSICARSSRSGARSSRRCRGRERVTTASGATMDAEAACWTGRAVARLEDGNLLRGAGRFIDDIELPGLLHACFVRSPVAHARLTGIDIAKARACKGVRAVLTYRDLRPHLTCDRVPLALPVAAIRFHVDPRYLADDELCYVGEPVALVVAETRAIAEDAASLVALDLEPLPVVLDPRDGLKPGAPKARLDCPDNLVAHWVVAYGDVETGFARATHRVSPTFRIQQGGGHSIEARGVVARYDQLENVLTVWDSTQMPHKAKRVLVDALGLAEDEVRVIAPDVGGGFGPKNPFYPEELVVPAAAMLLDRPIKWIEDRRESFTATNHERLQEWEVEAEIGRASCREGVCGA